ncbi:DUF5703 family protein [Pseudarthrobacter sp. J1738]|uniref:DUF5703 family protein n=1 Tax=unclassified Pseudarthrobacter TaxID=2647000 RepID=UPI003D28AA02
MKEQFPAAAVRRSRDFARQYEYMVLTVPRSESIGDARQRLVEHSEYGKWELERTVMYMGGARRFWLRRKVLSVQRTI